MKTASSHQAISVARIALSISLSALWTTASLCAADLSVSMTSSPNPAVTGGELTYTITVSNAGPTAATGVVLTNALSEGQSLLAAGACPEPGPVAWWKGEGDPADSAGANHGSLHGDATFAPGKVGQAFSLDGAGDYVRFPDAPSLRPSNFTIDGWFQPVNLSGIRILVSKTFGGASSVDNSFAIFMNEGQLNALVPRAGGFDTLTIPTPLTSGQWYHIAYTFDDPANTHVLYLNGAAAATGVSNTTLPYDSNPVLIGADIESGTLAYFFSGLADEVAIYDYTLSESQILAIYNADNLGKCRASTVFQLGELASETATSVSLTVRPTLCTDMVTNVVSVSANESDPDPSNNAATNILSVLDGIVPEIACAADKTAECGGEWDFDEPTASDDCGAVTLMTVSTVTNVAGFCGQTFEAIRTWEAMDLAGNVAQCSQTVTVMDTTPPTITCQEDKEASCEDMSPFDEPTVSDTCGEVVVSIVGTTTNTVGGQFLEFTRTWEASDGCGNSAQCSQTILVQDVFAPECAGDKTVECGSFWDFDTPIDACSAVMVNVLSTVTNTTEFCGRTMEVTRMWEAMDAVGNTMQCSQTVTVADLSPPACVADKMVECGSEWSFDDPFDECGTVTLSIVSTVTNTTEFCGQTFEITRTWDATDECGNMSQCSQTVTIVDSTPPAIQCVADKTVECLEPWEFDEPMAVDGCGAAAVIVLSTVTNVTGFCGGTFEAVRTWEATDDCGNQSQCTQTVSVVDTTAPMITCAAAKEADCETPWDFDDPTAGDSCGGVTVAILNTSTNAVGGGTFQITRTWEVTDDCGNTAQCGQTVTVQDMSPPTILCADDKTVECGGDWDFDAPAASDACGDVTVSIVGTVTNIAEFCGQTFEATRTWEAVDSAGNVVECSQKLTVVDSTPPTIECVADKTVECVEPWDFDEPMAVDGCGAVTLSILGTVTNGIPAGGYTATRTWQATDDCGNMIDCSQTVTASDAVPELGIVLDQNAGLVTLCWTAGCSGFVLEFTLSLDETPSWLDVEEPVMSVGSDNCVTTPASGGTRYFRLRQGP